MLLDRREYYKAWRQKLSPEERQRQNKANRARQKRYRVEKPDEIRANERSKMRGWRATLTEEKRATLNAGRKHRHATMSPEERADALARMRVASRRYYEKNKDEHNFKIAHRERQSKRRAKCGGAPIGVHREAIGRLMHLQRGKCASCGVDIRDSFHLDHIVPLAIGGAHALGNFQLLCPPCNLSKGAKSPLKFANERGRLL